MRREPCADRSSYDLDLDKQLSEQTTVLVESYTVRRGR